MAAAWGSCLGQLLAISILLFAAWASPLHADSGFEAQHSGLPQNGFGRVRRGGRALRQDVRKQALLPLPSINPYVSEVAAPFIQKKAVLLTGTGVSAQILATSPEVEPATQAFNARLIASWSGFVAQITTLAVGFGADPRLAVWTDLANWCLLPNGISVQAIAGNFTAQGFTSYTMDNITTLRTVAAKVWSVTGPCLLGAANAATLVQQELDRSQINVFPSLKQSFRSLIEQTFARRRMAGNPYAALVSPFAALASVAPVITTNYDIFLEQALGRASLDYQDLQQRGPKPWAPVTDFVESAEGCKGACPNNHTLYVVHTHGFVQSIGQFVITLPEYVAAQDRLANFMVPLVRDNSFIIVGSASNIFQPDFMVLWRKLRAAGSEARHFILLRESEAPGIIDTMAQLGDLGQWMMDRIRAVVYGRTFEELPVFLQYVAQAAKLRTYY